MGRCTRTARVIAGVVAAGLSGAAFGQAVTAFGPRPNNYPDIIVSSVGGSLDGADGIDDYGTANGISSYAIGSDSCNIGSHAGIWIDGGSFPNQHPVIGGQIYRLFNGRFEQIGMSWLKHGFCAADACSANQYGSNGCMNIQGTLPGASTGACSTDLGASGGGCDWLGYGRATDTYGPGLNGSQGYLGPRSEVNSWSGYYPYPYVRQGTNTNSCLNKRLLVRKSDFDPALFPRYNAANNPTGALYFGEVVYIMTDEWPNERFNGYSHRLINVGNAIAGGTGCAEATYQLSFTTANLTQARKTALEAWKVYDPTVKISAADAPSDGRFQVGCKVTDRGDGTWQYEYAVMNMNSDRGGASFSIPKAPAGVNVLKQEFKGVEYHSGEPYSQMPWLMSVGASDIRWETQTYAQNANANALRWSTLYNFRFIANVPPQNGSVRIGLFKPGVNPGDVNSVDVPNLLVPSTPATCPADFNASGLADLLDIFAFLDAWFNTCTGAGAPVPACTKSADFNGRGGVDLTDIFDFLGAWFAGCP